MAISYVGGITGSATNNGDVSLSLTALTGGSNSSPSQDDLVIVVYGLSTADNTDFNLAMITSGYTEVTDLFSDDTFEAQLGAYYKFMGATPDTTAQVDGLGGTDTAVAACAMVFRGVKLVANGGPFDTTGTDTAGFTTATGLNTMHPDPPSLNHGGVSGAWTVIGSVSGTNIASTTVTNPTNYTTDAISANNSDTDGRVFTAMGYNTSPADPENPGAITINGTDSTGYAWAAITMCLAAIATIDNRAEVSVFELSVPSPNNRAEVSVMELEIPTPNNRAEVSAFELSIPSPDNRAEVSVFELQIPDLVPDNRAEISVFEFEIPTPNNRAEVSVFELTLPNPDNRAEVSVFELTLPNPNNRAEVSVFEFEIPGVGEGAGYIGNLIRKLRRRW